MAKETPVNLAAARYKESGLTAADSRKLGMSTLTAAATQALGFDARPSIKIPYYDPADPTKPLSGWPGWPPFYRVRYLGTPLPGLGDQTKSKEQRYSQPPDTGMCAYFPTIIDWLPIMADASKDIIITEGEFKAAKACKEGFPTIGLGGVYSFQSSKLGIEFVNELDAINWVRRTVYILYDSDMYSNPQVCKAINALSEELLERGAMPMLVSLPDVLDDGKTGLDDFLLSASPRELKDLLKEDAQHLTQSQKLWSLNDNYAYVNSPGLVLETRTQTKHPTTVFKEHGRHSTKQYAERIVKADGSISIKKTPLAGAWLKWPMRAEVSCMTYMPGEGQYIGVENGRLREYNIWPGWGCQPKKGSVKPWRELLDHLFTGADKADREWFERWCAYPIQHPGTKLFTAAVMHGTRHGTGKSLIGYTLGRIYGKNFTEIGQEDIHASFNEWAEGKQFVMGDDVTGTNGRLDADKIKKMITQKEIRVNVKYVPSYVVPDCINYFFTSNHSDPFYLEDHDRRYFIHEIKVPPLSNEFYKKYMKWLTDGGAEALFYYLKNLDLKDFNPSAAALQTAAKRRMIVGGKSDVAAWVLDVKEDPDHTLVLDKIARTQDLFTSAELLAMYKHAKGDDTRVKAGGITTAMTTAGFAQVCNGNPVKDGDGTQGRYFAVRNSNKWLRATGAAVTDYLKRQMPRRK